MAELRDRGFAIVQGVFSRDRIEAMREVCERVLARKNRTRVRVPLELQRRPPLGQADVFDNPRALPVVRALLGDGFSIADFWIRATKPGGSSMHVHRDERNLVDRATDGPGELNLDIMLTDSSEGNGGTEIWPGSHRITDRDFDNLRHTRERVMGHPSVHIEAPAGSIALRDSRAWHRAGINRSDALRVLLSVVYARRPPRAP